MSHGRLRIGEVAELTGTTPRTIRYYEEIGLLPLDARAREPAATASTTRPTSSGCSELLRLKELLGLSLDELKELVAAEERARRPARASGATASTTRCGGARSSTRRSATSTASSSWSAAAATRSPSSSAS